MVTILVAIGAGRALPGLLTTTGGFAFQDGKGAPSAAGFVDNRYTVGMTAGPTVSTTLHGLAGVSVEALDATEFVVAIPPDHGWVLDELSVGIPPRIGGGVVCAFAFLTNGPPSEGTAAVVGAPSNCDATLPAVGPIASGCGDAVRTTVVVDLLHGSIVGSLSGACHVRSGMLAGDIVLFMSYAIVTSGEVTLSNFCSMTITLSRA